MFYCVRRDLKNFVEVDTKDAEILRERFRFLYLKTGSGIAYEDIFKGHEGNGQEEDKKKEGDGKKNKEEGKNVWGK